MTDIPDAAIEAAAEARWLQAKRDLRIKSRSDWATLPESTKTEWRHDTRAAIEAAIPAMERHFREVFAQEIERIPTVDGANVDRDNAARIVRGAQ